MPAPGPKALRVRWRLAWALVLVLLAGLPPGWASEYRPLPPASPRALSADWLIHDAARNRLIFYLPGYHVPAHAYYQWVRLGRAQPFPLSFAAQPGLSLFVDNQLVFTAHTAATYSLDLARLLPTQLAAGKHLLAVWQPDGSPALASFAGVSAAAPAPGLPAAGANRAQPRLPAPQGQNVYLGFLLQIGRASCRERVSSPV